MQYNECQICNKPLGSDTKTLGMPFCHECRKCSKCGEDLNSLDSRWCVRRSIESSDKTIQVIHPGCAAALSDNPMMSIPISEYERFNNLRLAFLVDDELGSTANLETARLHAYKLFSNLDLAGQMLQYEKIKMVLVALQTMERKNPEYHKDLIAERDRKIAKAQSAKVQERKAEREKERSEKPKSAIQVSPEEFQKIWHYPDLNEAKKQLTQYKDMIKMYIHVLKYSEERAIAEANEVFQKGLDLRLKNQNGL